MSESQASFSTTNKFSYILWRRKEVKSLKTIWEILMPKCRTQNLFMQGSMCWLFLRNKKNAVMRSGGRNVSSMAEGCLQMTSRSKESRKARNCGKDMRDFWKVVKGTRSFMQKVRQIPRSSGVKQGWQLIWTWRTIISLLRSHSQVWQCIMRCF